MVDGGITSQTGLGFAMGRRLDGWIAGEVRGEGNVLVPSLHVAEGEGGYVVTAAIPGAEKQELTVSVCGRVLRIAGERQEQHVRSDADGVTGTQLLSHFVRETSLPVAVDASRARARFENGLLTVFLPFARDDEGSEATIQPVEIN